MDCVMGVANDRYDFFLGNSSDITGGRHMLVAAVSLLWLKLHSDRSLCSLVIHLCATLSAHAFRSTCCCRRQQRHPLQPQPRQHVWLGGHKLRHPAALRV
jgi:hypothetical protein